MYRCKVYPTNSATTDVTGIGGYEFDCIHFNIEPMTDGEVMVALDGSRVGSFSSWLKFNIQTDLIAFNDDDNSAVENMIECAMRVSSSRYIVLHVIDYPQMNVLGIVPNAKILCAGTVTVEHRNEEGGKSLSFELAESEKWTG